MATKRLALSSMTCFSCRQWALRSFISAIGGPATQRAFPQIATSRRHLATSPRSRNESRSTVQGFTDSQFPINDINDDFAQRLSTQNSTQTPRDAPEPLAQRDDSLSSSTAVGTSASPSNPELSPSEQPSQTATHVPWYLQSSLIPESRPKELSARQQIPELPEHPPPILEALLQHVSVELGIDDLTLLDLRSLDPPPALGANLFMVIGTARSEKHLHVTADKLCRWLRTNHELTPYADGLLGRNELKIKLRRRAKRSKLLKSVGSRATADTDLEEGIRTGWVCVNLGSVEGGELPKSAAQLESEANIVGFSTSSTGSRIVVQLLTEEKRTEIGLERLWNGVLKKSARESVLPEDVDEAVEPAGIAMTA